MCALSRRSALAAFAGAVAGPVAPALANHEHTLFLNVAFAMRQRAIENGDQPFGAVVVRNGDVIGYGPSRVVAKNDPNAHAEREAIRDAQTMLNRNDLTDCVLYSTSRPCAACEKAAYDARISRMYYGRDATDAGSPRP